MDLKTSDMEPMDPPGPRRSGSKCQQLVRDFLATGEPCMGARLGGPDEEAQRLREHAAAQLGTAVHCLWRAAEALGDTDPDLAERVSGALNLAEGARSVLEGRM